MKKYKKIINYGFILALTLTTIVWIWKLRFFPQLQLRTLIISILAYLIWSYFYHKRDKSLTLTLFLEYVLTATLAIILLLGVLL